MRSKVSRDFVLLAPPSCGAVSANKSANVGALIFIVTLFGSVLIIAYHPPFVQRFLRCFPNFDIIHLTKYHIKESAMYRDSAKARVAARDLRKQQVKLFKLGATITLCAFLISQLAEIIF